MPSYCFTRLCGAFRQGVQRSVVGGAGVLQDSVEVLIGRGKLLICNSRFFRSVPFAALADLHVLLRPGALPASESNLLYLVNRRKNLSVVGTLSRTFSIPSVSGPSFHVCGYHLDHLLTESSQFLLDSDARKIPMVASVSRSVVSDHSYSTLASRHGLPRVSITTSITSFSNRSFHSCRQACMRMRSQGQPNNFLLHGYFIHIVANSMVNLDPYQAFGWKACSISSPAQFSAGTASNVSFDNSAREEPIVNITDSPEHKVSGEVTLKLHPGSCYLPHPEKEATGGEDAHFICADEQAIGVADGVGGWADLGVNAGLYARELMSNSVTAIQEEPKGSVDPARVLEKAYSSTKSKGSSTACIIALTDQGLYAINLGDSGFMVVRDGCTVFRSPVQQHDFNFTYQLESSNCGDLPSSGQVFTIQVAPGDVIVAGTDGLFDNLYNSDITAVVVHAIRAGLEPHVTAQKIAALARQRAQDKDRQTPFSAAAQEAGFRYYGGKLDDITVVVSYIASASNENSSARDS